MMRKLKMAVLLSAAIASLAASLAGAENYIPEKAGAEYIGQTLSFETVDVEDNPVSSADLFAENEITMVNLWGTWCPACMSEMEELAEIHKEFREKDCGIVGVELEYDWSDETVNASNETIEQNGIEYPNVRLPLDNELLCSVTLYPTSLFVDKDGKILASPIIGAIPAAYTQTMESLLAEKDSDNG